MGKKGENGGVGKVVDWVQLHKRRNEKVKKPAEC